jgi:hypothetical protein
MIRYPADDTTPMLRLRLFVEPVEIYDAAGKFIGLFVPANLDRGKKIYADATGFRNQTELDRIEATATGGRSTQEVLARLNAMSSDSAIHQAPVEPNGPVETKQCVSP